MVEKMSAHMTGMGDPLTVHRQESAHWTANSQPFRWAPLSFVGTGTNSAIYIRLTRTGIQA